MQVLPDPLLTPIIRHYLFLKCKRDGPKKFRLFTDGTMGMVFSCKHPLVNGDEQEECLPKGFLYGQITTFRNILVLNETDLAIVVFQPSGFNRLMGLPATDVREGIIPVENLYPLQSKELSERLESNSSLSGKTSLLNAFFLNQLSKNKTSQDTLINATTDFIIRNKGRVSGKQMEKFTGYTERQMERKFLLSVGMNPKRFGNITRLHFFIKSLKESHNRQSLSSLAYEAGYADQSHLIKEFNKITGMSPIAYRDHSEKLANNFVSYSMKGMTK